MLVDSPRIMRNADLDLRPDLDLSEPNPRRPRLLDPLPLAELARLDTVALVSPPNELAVIVL